MQAAKAERNKVMDRNESHTPEERMKEKGEHPVLCMRREEGEATFRYLVAANDAPQKEYSIYVEYQDALHHTTGEIPAFSTDRDVAETFCGMLERFGVTPLSLDAVYEDVYTP